MNDTADAEVFRNAVERLKIKTTDAPRLFSVTRQTLSSWIHGKSKIPKAAFVLLLELENTASKKASERVEHINTLARIVGRINQPGENAPDQHERH
jgi:DNA-binding transcriptional regulator YiaG